MNLPERFVESHGVDDIGVFSEVKEFLTSDGVPDFAGSIVGASDELVSGLVEGAVGQRKQVSSQHLKTVESLVFVLKLLLDQLLNQLLKLWLS